MAGAYVAKPAVVSVPDVPPGWDDDWPPPGATDPPWANIDPDPFFPAPYPPGYTPEFSLVMTATAAIAYNGTASVTGSMRDHDTYATNEPSAITWTATIGGAAINLRFSGDEDYESSLSSSVAFSTYWGATPSIEFELTGDNNGDVVTLTGTSTIDRRAISSEEEITIRLTATINLTVVNNNSDEDWTAKVQIQGQESGSSARGWLSISYTGSTGLYSTNEAETEDEITVVITEPNAEIQVNVFREELYDLEWILSTSGATGDVNFTMDLDIGGDIYQTELNLTGNDTYGQFWGDNVWLTINGETGEVTIINP